MSFQPDKKNEIWLHCFTLFIKFLIFIKPVFTLPSSIVKQWKSGDNQIV